MVDSGTKYEPDREADFHPFAVTVSVAVSVAVGNSAVVSSWLDTFR